MTKLKLDNMNMVKKEYIAPSIEVVEMETVSMLAGSQEEVTDDKKIGGGNRDEELDEELSNRRRNYWREVGGGW